MKLLSRLNSTKEIWLVTELTTALIDWLAENAPSSPEYRGMMYFGDFVTRDFCQIFSLLIFDYIIAEMNNILQQVLSEDVLTIFLCQLC